MYVYCVLPNKTALYVSIGYLATLLTFDVILYSLHWIVMCSLCFLTILLEMYINFSLTSGKNH